MQHGQLSCMVTEGNRVQDGLMVSMVVLLLCLCARTVARTTPPPAGAHTSELIQSILPRGSATADIASACARTACRWRCPLRRRRRRCRWRFARFGGGGSSTTARRWCELAVAHVVDLAARTLTQTPSPSPSPSPLPHPHPGSQSHVGGSAVDTPPTRRGASSPARTERPPAAVGRGGSSPRVASAGSQMPSLNQGHMAQGQA